MEKKVVRYGNHILNDTVNGYMYNLNYSDSYNFSSHIHHCYEFIHIIKGRLLYTVEGNDYMLSDGDIIMTTPEEFHSFSFPEKGFYQREFLHIYPGFLKRFPEMLDFLNSRKAGKYNLLPSELVKKYGLDIIFRNFEKCCLAPDSSTDLLMLTHTVQMIVQIKRLLEAETIRYKAPVSNEKSNSIRYFIDYNYDKPITVPDIAEATFMSVAYASRLFKKETGLTIKAYLNLRRVTQAKNLMMEGRKATEIFDKCGFLDYSTFYRAFVKYVGMAPKEFKA